MKIRVPALTGTDVNGEYAEKQEKECTERLRWATADLQERATRLRERLDKAEERNPEMLYLPVSTCDLRAFIAAAEMLQEEVIIRTDVGGVQMIITGRLEDLGE